MDVRAGLFSLVLRPQEWDTLPADWTAVFGRSAPLAVEVGFGNGEFLVREALARTEWDFVGFDVTLTCVENAAQRVARAGLGNLRLVKLDGRFGLRELFSEGSVHLVYVNFPCPWPKARHADRRIFRDEFVSTLAAVLVQGGEVQLVTDDDWYARQAKEELESGRLFSAVGPQLLADGGPDTRYEHKWRLQGRDIWEVRGSCEASPPLRRMAEGDMPHAVVRRSVAWAEVKRLAGWVETWSGGAFAIREVFLGVDGNCAVMRTFSTDGGFQQQYFLLVALAKQGTVVKLDGATVPFRTPAVKRSVTDVAAALQEGGRQ